MFSSQRDQAARRPTVFSRRARTLAALPGRRNRSRVLALESLESRELLTASLAPIANVAVPATLGYQVPLDGTGTTANQTFTVSSTNSHIKATVAQGQFITFNITHTASSQAGDFSFSGPVTFELFNDLTPQTATNIENFITSGFYNSKQLFRVANGFPGPGDFIIQGGSPTNSATGLPSGLPGTPFGDEFNPQLAFTGNYQLAMANSGPNTNDSQFFITDSLNNPPANPRFLDMKYTIFGQLVAGQSIINDMTQVALSPGTTTPVNPIAITSATVSSGNPDGVIHIDATNALPGATSTITVTATDPSTNTHVTQTFQVAAAANTQTEPPYVAPMPNMTIGEGQVTTFRIPSVSPTPNDPLTYTVQGGVSGGTFTPLQNATATVFTNGIVQLTPASGFSGTINVLIGVRDNVNRAQASSDNPANYDWQQFTLTVNPSTTPVPLLPIAVPFSQSLTEGTTATVQLRGVNTETSATPPTPTFAITAQPTHGTITSFDPSNGSFVYTPAPGFIGADRFQYTVTATGGGLPNPLTSTAATVTLNVNSALTILSTNPANGSVVSSLPNGQITITFSRHLAGLTDGGPANLPSDPYGVFLLARGPALTVTGASGVDSGNLPLHANTIYHANADGTSTITITPLEPLSADLYVISINLSKFTDLSGDPLYDPNHGYYNFLLRPPATTSAPLQVVKVTTYNGYATVNNNAIFQPDTFAIQFNKPLWQGATQNGNFQINANPGPNFTIVPSVAVYSPTTDTVYLTPTAPLTPGTKYVIRVDSSVSDDQGLGSAGNPLGQTYYDGFTVLNPPAGAGQSPMRVATDSTGKPRITPGNGMLWGAPVGYASVQFTEPIDFAPTAFFRFSVILDPHTVGSDNNVAMENLPLNAKLAFNPNTNTLIIVPTEIVPNAVYSLGLSIIQSTTGDHLLNSAGTQAGVTGPPYYATFQVAAGSAFSSAIVSTTAAPAVASDSSVTAALASSSTLTRGTQTPPGMGTAVSSSRPSRPAQAIATKPGTSVQESSLTSA